MQDYFYIKEKLEKFNFSERLAKLGKKFKNKKIVILGLNNSFKLLNAEYNIESYFNIVGITDFHLQIPEEEKFRLIHIDNLYFSGADVIVNFKENGSRIEKYLRKKRLIKKKMKFINIIDKSFLTKVSDNIALLKKIYTIFKKTKQIIPIVKDLINYGVDDVFSRFNYKEKILELSENTTNPIRVMFFVFNYKQWTLSNLYFELRANKHFRILPIVVLPDSLTNKEYNSVEETIKYFQEKGYACVEGVEKDTCKAVIIKALKPDIIFYQQPNYLRAEYTPECLSEYALTCYVEPDFAVTKQDDHINSFLDNRLNNTWCIYSSNKYSLKQYKNVKITGSPIFEKYSQNISQNIDSLWYKSKTEAGNRIIYSPSLIVNKRINKNDFLEYQKEMLYYISTHLQYDFVIVPHKCLKKQCLDNAIFSEDDYDSYLTNMTAFQHIFPKNINEAIQFYRTSDVLITDNILTAIEYFPSGKPIIYIDKGQERNLNEIGEKIFKTFYVVSSIESMNIVLEDLLLAKNDYNFKKRFSLIGKFSDYFNKKTSEIIIEDLKNTLKIENSSVAEITQETANIEQNNLSEEIEISK